LGSEYGVESCFLGGEKELHSTVQIGIGDADGGKVKLGGSIHRGLNGEEGVVKTVKRTNI
jgi:hypothetical protein